MQAKRILHIMYYIKCNSKQDILLLLLLLLLHLLASVSPMETADHQHDYFNF